MYRGRPSRGKKRGISTGTLKIGTTTTLATATRIAATTPDPPAALDTPLEPGTTPRPGGPNGDGTGNTPLPAEPTERAGRPPAYRTDPTASRGAESEAPAA